MAAYGIKYPDRVGGIVFAEPWGFKENPITTRNETEGTTTAAADDEQQQQSTLPPLWNRFVSNVTNVSIPTTLMRKTGKLGLTVLKIIRSELIKNYVDLIPEDPYLVCKYIYNINSLTPKYK